MASKMADVILERLYLGQYLSVRDGKKGTSVDTPGAIDLSYKNYVFSFDSM